MRYRRNKVAGGSFFFTVVTHRRASAFRDTALVHRLGEAFRHVATARPFHTDAIVLLPDHLHCIWRLPDGDADYPTRWRLIKHFVAVDGAAPLWQARYWEHTLRDEDDWRRHVDYIHYNPVKHGLVARPEDWPHSTYRRYLERGLYPVGWGHGAAPDDLPADTGE